MSAAASELRRRATEESTEMATTSGNLVAGKVLAGQGGNGDNGRYGLKAKVMASVAILGCAAALAFGGLRQGDAARPAEQAGPLVSSAQTNGVLSYEQVLFLEDNLTLPSAGTSDLHTTDQFTYREDRRVGLPPVTAPALDWATILLIEQNQLPELTSAPPGVCLPGELGGCDR